MAENWQKDKDDADVFMPQVKRILGPLLLVASSDIEDRRENTDLRVLHARDQRIAVRVRRMIDAKGRDCFAAYQHQFTIRLARTSGVETELSKIAGGWGDWFFYGWGDYATGRLRAFRIIDLAAFRRRLVLNLPPVTVSDVPNRDGRSTLRGYLAAEFPFPCIVKEGCCPELREGWTSAR